MKKISKHNVIVLSIYGFLFVAFTFIVIFCGKEKTHLLLNKYNNDFFDFLFFYITKLGEGVALASIIIGAAFYKLRYSLVTMVSVLLSFSVVTICKRCIWYNAPRPSTVFKNMDLHYIKGIVVHSSHSFPSGHTAAGFALFMMFVLLAKNPLVKIFYFIVALLIGFSRIYLSQHFITDVLAGSLIGTLSSIFCYYIIIGNNLPKWCLLDKSVYSIRMS